MRDPRTRRKLLAGLVGLPAAILAVIVLSGCGSETYPEDLVYPPRTDPLAIEAPKQSPLQLDGPGQWDQLRVEYREMGGKLIEPASLPNRDTVQTVLDEMFGSPAHPRVDVSKASEDGKMTWKKLNGLILDGVKERQQKKQNPEDAEDRAELEQLNAEIAYLERGPDDPLRVSDETLAEGSKLYRRQCLHCHGLSGDGRGPTAFWVNPHPRDYRKGLFKFTSSSQSGWNPLLGETGSGQKLGASRRPLRADLIHTMQQGIDGTSMPSFGQLPEEQLEKIASYVIHLSLRGEVEVAILTALNDSREKGLSDKAIRKQMALAFQAAVSNWMASQGAAILVKYPFGSWENLPEAERKAKMQDSIRTGYRLFAAKGKTWQDNESGMPVTKSGGLCIECHADYGRQFNYKWDDWGNIVRPADVTAGIYRGGRRPVDLFYRLHSGVNGTPMPTVLSGSTSVNDVWHLVHFLQAVPYPAMLPEDVRKEIYPGK